VLNGDMQYEVRCRYCALRLVVDRIRVVEATAMGNHLRERHPELELGATAALGDVLDNYRVTRTRR